MTEYLEAGVTPQTVRHHMIKHGIHEPGGSGTDETVDDDEDTGAMTDVGTPGSTDAGSSDRNGDVDAPTTSDGDGQGIDDSADGPRERVYRIDDVDVSLPASVDVEDVVRAVESSKTLHQVRRQLGTDVEETRDALQQLNLLDLVTGRLATRPDEDPDLDEITERIHRASAD